MLGVLRGVVALDGPSGTGKTTVARKLAERLDAGYLDTGAMYRAVTLAALRAGVDVGDPDAVIAVAESADLGVGTDPDQPVVVLDEEDVGEQIRGAEVTSAVSAVAAVPHVREMLVEVQRAIIDDVVDELGGIVVEGRDIGTVVAPDAALKVYLTASAEVRAGRRSAQDTASGRQADVEDVQAAVERRDSLDAGRAADPMRPAADAEELDTSDLELEQVIAALVELAAARDMLVESEVDANSESGAAP
ncbi:cytidylate kinase [Haloechinothrix alba]|uniref:Cytidylate kinase n=1 Tax=Haloechinothrix alba TaxID=664784 RepID=A0A238ZW10_9PSEU|nr:(d)CMP kinase [Haloechinothrix alba]SNR87181.1 cytidylate kinase [Haloechinothrix alba]